MGAETAEKVKSMFCEGVDRANVVVDDVYKNHISSSKPAYMHKDAMEKLEQSVNDTSEALDDERVSSQAVEFMRRKLSREKKRLHDIREQTPKYTQVEMKEISTARIALDDKIQDALFTKTDMEKGLVDPSKEADRMTLPCIEVDRKLAAMCNVKLTNGKCTRSEAEGIRKMALWHETNGEAPAFTEELRRDSGRHALKSPTVSMSDIPKERYDMAFPKDKFAALEQKIEELEARLEKKQEAKAVQTYKPEEVEMWTCPDCDKEMKAKGKNFHLARWCPARKTEKVEENKE